jgi:hypothetical protein
LPNAAFGATRGKPPPKSEVLTDFSQCRRILLIGLLRAARNALVVRRLLHYD